MPQQQRVRRIIATLQLDFDEAMALAGYSTPFLVRLLEQHRDGRLAEVLPVPVLGSRS